MTGPADLPNAIGLNSALFQVARIIGPAFAGVTIVVVGTGWCFALNALSFVAVIGALMAMDVSRPAPPSPGGPGQGPGARRAALHPRDARAAVRS